MNIALLLIALVILTVACLRIRGGVNLFAGARPAAARPAPRATPPARTQVDPSRGPSSAPPGVPAPQLEMLDWNDPRESGNPPAAAAQARIRDRYLALRFNGAIRNSGDLLLTGRVIDAARLYFEEDHADCAQELLALAIEASPRDVQLRLARIEIAFLTRDGAGFLEAARELDTALPGCAQWTDVQRLGRALHADEPLFRVAGEEHADETCGPWPDTPNWIGISWDLTGDVLAAEFHHSMSRAQPLGRPALRSAA